LLFHTRIFQSRTSKKLKMFETSSQPQDRSEKNTANTPVIYVYAPKYVTWSAGIRALHYLCHSLNELGFRSWVAIHGPVRGKEASVNPDLDTPFLTRAVADEHLHTNTSTIAIYPESVDGNPLNASVTVKWILNFPGLLGGETHYLDDFVVAYSLVLSDSYAKVGNERIPVIFYPVVDLYELDRSVANFRETDQKRKLLYCQKFRALGGKPADHGEDIFEVTRFQKGSPKREQLLNLILNAPEVIVYENSTIITEAQLLGTPVRCISNQWFDSLIAEEELGSYGVVWNKEALEMSKSVSIELTRQRYATAMTTFYNELSKNARSWIEEAELHKASRIRLPTSSIISRHSLTRALSLFKSQGMGRVMSFGLRYVQRVWRDRNS